MYWLYCDDLALLGKFYFCLRSMYKTDWLCSGYWIKIDSLDVYVLQNGHVLCIIFHKDGLGPKNNAQYGAPFKEEDWNDGEEVGFVEVASSGFPTPASVLPNNYSSSFAAGTSQCDGSASESYLSETVLSEREVLPAVHSINVVSKEDKKNKVFNHFCPFFLQMCSGMKYFLMYIVHYVLAPSFWHWYVFWCGSYIKYLSYSIISKIH